MPLIILIILLIFPLQIDARDGTNGNVQRHDGLARYDDLALPIGFAHFPYVNPDAPKGGALTLAALGTFDTLNPFTLKGVSAAGAGMTFATLLEPSLDEPASAYGYVADSVIVAPDKLSVRFHLRSIARFDDGKPITPDDVIFSFKTLREKGHPFFRSYYREITEVKAVDANTVVFRFARADNPELLSIVGQMPILPRHALQDQDFAATTFAIWPSSGAYRIQSIVPGRSIVYARIADWWGKDLPVSVGRFNFDTIRYDYYRDTTVSLEAFLAGRSDFRLENVARDWEVSYNTPAVRSGQIKRAKIPNELPAGMQAFVMNTRRPLFKDRKVREALSLAFDFEWANKHVAWGAYTRTTSFFANSDLSARGLPSPEELAILEPYRDRIPAEVFTKEFSPPVTDGSGNNRDNLKRAAELLKEAGWSMKDGTLKNDRGESFAFDLINTEPVFERWIQPFRRNLERLGIRMNYRIIDSAQYQNIVDNLDFDMIINVFGAPLVPGLEQREYWGSGQADEKGTRNLIGIKNPVVDELIAKIMQAQDRQSLIVATRALDRVLLWNHYVIPQWHIGSNRIAWWNYLEKPVSAPRYGLGAPDTWWRNDGKSSSNSEKSK